jgi:hypothetical protein
MRLRFALPLLSVLMLVAADVPEAKSPEARAALAKYQAAVKSADDAAARAKVAAGKELVAALEKAKRGAMAGGDLQGANEVQAMIDSAGEDSVAKAPTVEGRYLYGWLRDGERIFNVDEQGKIVTGGGDWEKTLAVGKAGVVVSGDVGVLQMRQLAHGAFSGKWPNGAVAVLIRLSEKK